MIKKNPSITVGTVIHMLRDYYNGLVTCKEYGIEIDCPIVHDMYFEIKLPATINQTIFSIPQENS